MTASRGLHGTEENTGSERGSLATSDLLATPPSLGPQVLHTRGGASEPRSAEASLGGWSLTGSVRDEAPSSRPGRHTWAYFFAVGPTMHTPLTASFKLGCLQFICSPGFLPGCDFLGSGLRMGSQFRAHGSSLSPTVPPPPSPGTQNSLEWVGVPQTQRHLSTYLTLTRGVAMLCCVCMLGGGALRAGEVCLSSQTPPKRPQN